MQITVSDLRSCLKSRSFYLTKASWASFAGLGKIYPSIAAMPDF